MSVRWHTYPDPSAASEACAHQILAHLEESLAGNEFATLAVSGGSTPRIMFPIMAKAQFAWDRVHLFWVDERCVPPTDDQSNYKLALETLIAPAHIPMSHVHRIAGEMEPESAARHYAAEIREIFNLENDEFPHFDVIHRGMGPDAHTASLFPGDPLIDDREHIVGSTYVEKFKQSRVTLLSGTLLAAKHTVFLVAGADKKEAVRAVFQEEYDPKKYPAQIGAHHGRAVTWFLDQPAAELVG
jgi:6-phosphogluconolactonase